jgi:outer membrane protein insertion porin family
MLSLAVVLSAARAFAQAPAPIITAVRVEGYQRVEGQAIQSHITQPVGVPLDEAAVDRDIKAIYRMGFFDSVTADVEREPGGAVLVYKVKERPQVTEVKLEGMSAIRTTDDKVVAAVRVHAGSILDPNRVRETVRGLTQVYEDRGYLDAKVTFQAQPGAENTTVAVFQVEEGQEVRVTSISFEGNKEFSDSQLRAAMQTSSYIPLVSLVTTAGMLDRTKLRDDVDRITALYYDNGFLNVRVAQPELTRDGNDMKILIRIDEGPPFKVGRITLEGDLKFPRSELRRSLTLKTGELFRGSIMQHDVLTLSDFYSNRGYAFVNVDPRTQLDPATKRVNVAFNINPGQEVLVDRINITGNSKTADKVVRRELQVQEQEPYSAEKIRESKIRLDRLGFFSDTRITTAPAQKPDRINLNVNVAEANTATLTAAGGFDSFQSLFGTFTLGNTNLFGGGQSVLLSAQVGFLFQNFSFSYTEPWLFDIPLSVGFQLFSTATDLFTFDQEATGFGINSYYPLTELGLKQIGPFSLKDVTAGLGYQFQRVGITNIAQLTTIQITEFEGYTTISQIIPSIRRFTVDNPIDPRSGTVSSLTMQIAGLGPGEAFLKGVAHFRYFYPFLQSPVFGNWVVSQGVTFGIGTNLGGGTGGELPLYERFFPGGVGVGSQGDVRGYQLYSLGPTVTIFNQQGNPIAIQNVGGSQELLFSNEITFPLLSGLGIRGVAFIDAGQAFRLQDSLDITKLQAAVSPFGPLAINLAFPINPRQQDLSPVFEIGAGTPL